MGEGAALDQSSESSPSKCGWSGLLPGFKQPALCQACDKLRSAGEVIRCQRNGGPQIEGAGDLVKTVLSMTGIGAVVNAVLGGDCGGCLQRQRLLNAAIPFTSPALDVEPNPPSGADTAGPSTTESDPPNGPRPAQ